MIDNCYSDAILTIKGEGYTRVGGVVGDCSFLSNSYHRGYIVINGKVIDSRAKNKKRRIEPGALRVGGVSVWVNKKLSNCYNTCS